MNEYKNDDCRRKTIWIPHKRPTTAEGDLLANVIKYRLREIPRLEKMSDTQQVSTLTSVFDG